MKPLVRICLVLAILVFVGVMVRPRAHAQSVDYRHFSHTSAAHKAINCDDCHKRQETMGTTPRLPGHSACITCHVTQFTSQPLVICANCHQDVKSRTPAVDSFPVRTSFDVSFDSKQHENHMGYLMPGAGNKVQCDTCHKVTSAAETMPGHPECYICHTSGVASPASQKSGCVTCHPGANGFVKSFASMQASAFYKYRFSHNLHDQRSACSDCHTLAGRDSLPPSKPLWKANHKSTCFSCHNGSRAFGDTFDNCSKCHGDSVKAPGS
ncbi:MAG TPA: cytochrome c3 family protein [Blastocatellia bacterium]|nr:cytochrome c3 family protein [Blastocatellia bacterium]